MVNRYKKNNGLSTFVPFNDSDSASLLQTVLKERRKELLMRGLRWMDIKRLNRDGANISLMRTLGTKTYSLPANDPKYAIALPEIVIELWLGLSMFCFVICCYR